MFHVESIQLNLNHLKCPVAAQAFFCFCEYDREGAERSSSLLKSGWRSTLQFWSLALLMSVMGSRVSSLIVLEFCLRAVSAWASAGLVSSQTLSVVPVSSFHLTLYISGQQLAAKISLSPIISGPPREFENLR